MFAIPFTLASRNGLRPVQDRHDLAQIADLIELCFAETLDSGGRSTIEEMRTIARMGPLWWFLQGLDRMVKGLVQGFVWEEGGQIVGNVSLYPAAERHTWAVANVAVHPDYRGRGIAQALCQAALERITEWGGQSAILQVDADNDPAKAVYYRLGFYAQRGFTRWYWSFYHHSARAKQAMPHLTYRSWGDSQAAYALAELVRPNRMGGLGWLRPLEATTFGGGLWSSFSRLVSPTSHEDWVLRGPQQGLQAMLMTRSNFGSGTLHFDLMIHPDQQGQLERPLLVHTLRRAADQFRNASTEHPTDDRHARAVFEELGFEARRTLIHMRWDRHLV